MPQSFSKMMMDVISHVEYDGRKGEDEPKQNLKLVMKFMIRLN